MVMHIGVYEVREYINGRTDWYSHWFDGPRSARAWIVLREDNLPLGADIVFRKFDESYTPDPIYILDEMSEPTDG